MCTEEKWHGVWSSCYCFTAVLSEAARHPGTANCSDENGNYLRELEGLNKLFSYFWTANVHIAQKTWAVACSLMSLLTCIIFAHVGIFSCFLENLMSYWIFMWLSYNSLTFYVSSLHNPITSCFVRCAGKLMNAGIWMGCSMMEDKPNMRVVPR